MKPVALVYLPSTSVELTDYAARTCYQSRTNKTKHPYDFIMSLIKSGHESVIEHAYCIIKVDKKEYSAGTVLRFLNSRVSSISLELEHIKVVADMVETDTHYYMSLNMRSLRNALRIMFLGYNNKLTLDISEQLIPLLPSCYFSDLYESLEDNRLNHYTKETLRQVYSGRMDVLTDLTELDEMCLSLKQSGLSPSDISLLVKTTFRMVLPRWASTQLNRHRGFSISAQSLRYVKLTSDNFRCHKPVSLKDKRFNVNIPGLGTANLNYNDVTRILSISGQELSKLGVRAEDCRNVYPLSVYTETVYTSSIADLNHVFKLRLKKDTQLDTRSMMYFLYMYLKYTGFHTLTESIMTNNNEESNIDELYDINDPNY